MELAPFSYVIQYRPGQTNVGPDTFTRAYCSAVTMTSSTLQDIHDMLCHLGATRLLHFVHRKNLPFSTTDVKRIISTCKICAQIKPFFVRNNQGTIIKAMRPIERISIDFKRLLPSSTPNKYLLIVVDEYSRFPFAFPCKDMTTQTVICCLDLLFTLCGTAGFFLCDNASSFLSLEFKAYLTQRGIASNKCSIYHPSENGQAERMVQTVWKIIQQALKTANLPHEQWEMMLTNALHSIRSLLCKATNATPHERFFAFQRRSSTRATLPTWLTYPGSKAYLRRFVRTSKIDPLVDEVEIINVNPNYANVRHLNGREVTFSLNDLSPCPSKKSQDYTDTNETQPSVDAQSNKSTTTATRDNDADAHDDDVRAPSAPVLPRRSAQTSKGVPPLRYGIHDSSV